MLLGRPVRHHLTPPAHTKGGCLVFRLGRTFLQGCGERRIAGSAVDKFGRRAERDHHAPGRVANRVLAVGAYLERAVRAAVLDWRRYTSRQTRPALRGDRPRLRLSKADASGYCSAPC